jgi:hypothetical protein
MASIFLHRRELGGGTRLPNFCVVCGRRGQMTEVAFHRQEVVLPLCQSHRNYFTRGIFMLVGVAVLTLVFLAAAGSYFIGGLTAFAEGFLVFVASVAVFGAVSFVVTVSRARASAIDDRGVWLAGVSQDFADAVEDLRDGRRPGRVREQDPRAPAPSRASLLVAMLAGGAAVGLLVCAGLAIWFLVSGSTGLLAWGRGGPVSTIPPIGENFEKNKQGMPTGATAGGPATRPTAGGSPVVPGTSPPRPPSTVTVENFRKLKLDMTATEVRDILGPPTSDSPLLGLSWLDGSNLISIRFMNDRVSQIVASINGQSFSLPDLSLP